MHRTGRPGRGERGRVAVRTRALLGSGEPEPAPRGGGWLPGGLLGGDAEPQPGDETGGRRRTRWQPDRRTVLALAAVVAVVAAATLWWVLSARPSEVAVRAVSGSAVPVPTAMPLGNPPGAPPAASPAPRASARPDLVVDVAGKVRRPGVYRLPDGARVIDAVHAAGGALPGVSTVSLNLAAPLSDGQQVVVGVAAAPAAPASGAPGGATGGPVNLNAAGLEQLEALPGVGPVLAQNILDWRNEHGRFTTVDQLNEVTGIGEVKFATLRPHVTV